MAILYVVRHGETAGNEKQIYRGRWDLPLTERGKDQVQHAAMALSAINFDAIYTSPLMRARETAQAIIVGRRQEARIEEGFIDIDYGRWTRIPESEVTQKFPDLHNRWLQSPGTVVFPEGEGLQDIRSRVEPAMVRAVEAHSGKPLAIVSHRVPIKMMILCALGLPDEAFWKVQVDTASISCLEFQDGQFKLSFMNDTCHLAGIGSRQGAADF